MHQFTDWWIVDDLYYCHTGPVKCVVIKLFGHLPLKSPVCLSAIYGFTWITAMSTVVPQGHIESCIEIGTALSHKKHDLPIKRLKIGVKYWIRLRTGLNSICQPQIYLGFWGIQYAPCITRIKACIVELPRLLYCFWIISWVCFL